jgi:cell division protein FtsA
MDTIFALDIGTRVVLGLVMKKNLTGYEILASARTEHRQRAMYDGQVHDVTEVAKAVIEVKNILEEKTGLTLENVAVAAAGRALKTEKASAVREENFIMHWQQEDVLALEMEAVQEAQKAIEKSIDTAKESAYYCAGYSTVKQSIEDEQLSSIAGQRGKKIAVEVVATFLPRTVVDGLLSVLEKAGLKMLSLTLEPIAAGQAAIPPDMRRMNLALVDIGAGTSDIALTNEGVFFSFGMVPMAGDEITEAICSHYLLDFQEGENVKRRMTTDTEFIFSNFFGQEVITAKDEVLEIIKPGINELSEKIAKEILVLNGKPPQAAILIGGGSLTPDLAQCLSDKLSMPGNRVGIQIRERLANIIGDANLSGSDVITSIGIGIIALEEKGLKYYTVSVNGTCIPIFETHITSVAEALLAAGLNPRLFAGKPGLALLYWVNGDMHVIKGKMGNPADITVNGEPASLESKLAPNDIIEFVPGTKGVDPRVQIKDILELSSEKKVYINGQDYKLVPEITLNGVAVTADHWIEDEAKIELGEIETLGDLIKKYKLPEMRENRLSIYINGTEQVIYNKLDYYVN